MKKLSSTLPHMVLSLGLVSIIAAGLLGGMYVLTKEPVAAQEKQARISAIKQVAPEFDNDPEADAREFTVASGVVCTVYPASLTDASTERPYLQARWMVLPARYA